MRWLAPLWFAEIHREVYVALLKSWIPHGQRGDFAQRVGITREYLSYLCALGEDVERRLPSARLAQRLAAALPAPPEIKRSLVENIDLARVLAAQVRYDIRSVINQRRVSELIAELDVSHQQATFGVEAVDVARQYRFTRDAALLLLSQISPESYPAAYAQTCMYLHDAQCILDRADDALRWSKIAALVLENVDQLEDGIEREYADNLYINTVRGQAVAYNNLGLYRRVPEIVERARHTNAYRNANDFWMPLVGRDTLTNLSCTPRFSIRQARRIAREIENQCERKGDTFTFFLARESLVRCLIQHEEWKPAYKLLGEEVALLPRLPYVGTLHRALLFKTQALFAWHSGDRQSWKLHVSETLRLVHQAGLRHQYREVIQIYGGALTPVLDELKLSEKL